MTRLKREDRRVLAALGAIPDAALQRWIAKHYTTVMRLARLELARRATKEARRGR